MRVLTVSVTLATMLLATPHFSNAADWFGPQSLNRYWGLGWGPGYHRYSMPGYLGLGGCCASPSPYQAGYFYPTTPETVASQNAGPNRVPPSSARLAESPSSAVRLPPLGRGSF